MKIISKIIIRICILLFFLIVQYKISLAQTEPQIEPGDIENPYNYVSSCTWSTSKSIDPTPSSATIPNFIDQKQYYYLDPLGFTTDPFVVIQNSGCILTCLSMVLAANGTGCTPPLLNNWLKVPPHQGFLSGTGSLYNAPAGKLIIGYDNSTITWKGASNTLDKDAIISSILEGNPVVIVFKWIPVDDPNKPLLHGVVVKGFSNNGTTYSDINISDPGDFFGAGTPISLFSFIDHPHWQFSQVHYYDNVTYPLYALISGNVHDINTGNGIPNVTFQFTGNNQPINSTLSSSTGNFEQTENNNSIITITPSKEGYTFDPPFINTNVACIMSTSFTGTFDANIAFSKNPNTSIINGNSINFTDISYPTPNSWNWSFPGGIPSTSSINNPVILYNTAGDYDVSLTITYDNGFSKSLTKNNYISVINAIGADFTYSIDINTKTVHFTDISTNNPDTWYWEFGDGSTSTIQNPSHTFSFYNSYTVKLTASKQYSSSSKTTIITIDHPDLTISGRVVVNYLNGMSGVTVEARKTDGTLTNSFISGSNGDFTISVPYNWSGKVSAASSGYASIPVIYSNPLQSPITNLLLNLSPVQLSISPSLIAGAYYKFEAVGDDAIIGITNFQWYFSGNGINENFSSNIVWWYNYLFECSPSVDLNYTINLIVTTDYGQTFTATPLTLTIQHCTTVTSLAIPENNCSSVPLGDYAIFEDKSHLFSDISRVVVWYSDGTSETWDTENCNYQGCSDADHSLYVANCRKLEHLFSSQGHYNVSLQAYNLANEGSPEYFMGFNVVDCNSTSTNFSNAVYDPYNNIHNYFAGTFDLSSLNYISNNHNKNININACNEIVLESGVTIEPNPGYTVTLQLDPCLQGNNTANARTLETSNKDYEIDNYKSKPVYKDESLIDNNIDKPFSVDNDIKLYPNPNNGKFLIETINPNIKSLQIYNSLGEVLKSFDNIVQTLYMIDISNYAIGVYYLKVNTDKDVKLYKIIYSLVP